MLLLLPIHPHPSLWSHLSTPVSVKLDCTWEHISVFTKIYLTLKRCGAWHLDSNIMCFIRYTEFFFLGFSWQFETPILWPPHAKSWLTGKDPEGLGAGGEGDDRGWDGWMASLTRWTWVWVNSRSWWWTGRPGVLRFMGLQRVGHDWATELNWTEICNCFVQILVLVKYC